MRLWMRVGDRWVAGREVSSAHEVGRTRYDARTRRTVCEDEGCWLVSPSPLGGVGPGRQDEPEARPVGGGYEDQVVAVRAPEWGPEGERVLRVECVGSTSEDNVAASFEVPLAVLFDVLRLAGFAVIAVEHADVEEARRG